MKSIKVAIGRGIYNIPTTDDTDINSLQLICSSINSKINSLIAQNNLKNEPNDLLILLATIEMLKQQGNQQNTNQNHQQNNDEPLHEAHANLSGNDENLENFINAEVERAILTHLNSLFNSIKKMMDS